MAWIFKKRGIISVLKDQATEDQLMEIALEAGAEDIRDDDEVWTIDSEPGVFLPVKEALEKANIELVNAEVDNIPDNRVEVAEESKAESVLKLIAALEELDDVANVYANYDIAEEVLERVG